MRVSTRARYAARAMVDIAAHLGAGPVSLTAISERQDISVKYLEQLLASLRAYGLVCSVRGRHGGYLLARPPADISLLDIFLATEGAEALTPCGDARQCRRSGDCALQSVWGEMQAAMAAVLESATLSRLAKRATEQEQRAAAVYGI